MPESQQTCWLAGDQQTCVCLHISACMPLCIFCAQLTRKLCRSLVFLWPEVAVTVGLAGGSGMQSNWNQTA